MSPSVRDPRRAHSSLTAASSLALGAALLCPARAVAQQTTATTATTASAAPPPGAATEPSAAHFSAAQLIADAEAGNGLPAGAQVDTPVAETPEQRARRESEGYVREVIADADTSQVPESWQYYRGFGRAMASTWVPPRAHPPGMFTSITNNLFINRERMTEITRRSVGGGVAYAVGESMNYVHPNSPMPLPRHTASAIESVTAQVTSAEVEVDQNERGEVIGVRVVHSSRDSDFDQSAMASARAAAASLPAVPMPGGWRSRWSFEQSVGRDPFVLLSAGLPGEAPVPTMYFEAEFDEVTGLGEVHAPGRVHVRRRVRLLQSHVIRSASAGSGSGATASTAHSSSP